MKPTTNKKIAQVLDEIADAMEIRGDNPFRIRAYRRAVQAIENLPRPAGEIYAAGGTKGLQEIPGVGEGIAARIVEMLETGGLREYRRETKAVPEAVRELLHIPNIGPKSVKVLREKLKIRGPEDLEKACLAGRVRDLPGFGEVKEAKILAAVQAYRGRERRFLVSEADEYAALLAAALRKVKGVERVETAGSFRRRKETVGDLDFLVTARAGAKVMDAFTGHESVDEVLVAGGTKASVRLENGMQADLRLVDPDCYGAALLYFTGSKQHNVALRTRAKAAGLKISEYGVFKGRKRVAGATEEEIYDLLGLAWIPPELREDAGEIEAAAKGALPRLVELDDVRGDLQTHTTGSDGKNTPREMAEAARDLGYEYVAITDHSKAVAVAGGMDDEKFGAWCKRLDAENRKLKGIRILKGAEVDILKDGSLDLGEKTLRELDWVVATVHSYFDLSRKAQTRRVIEAVRSGLVHVWGHPTSRRIGKRDPIDVDLEEVFRACAEAGVAVEIDGHPERLDLEARAARAARDAGLKIALSTDAHSTDGLQMMRYAVGVARRGWLEPGDILNTLPLARFLKATRRG